MAGSERLNRQARAVITRAGPLGATAAASLLALGLSATVAWALTRVEAIAGHAVLVAAGTALLVAVPSVYCLCRVALRLEAAEERLDSLATVDDLTQVFNRQHLIAMTENELARARRYGNTFSVIVLAVDDFQAINERAGRMAGDKVLQTVTATVRRQLRPTDALARFGGAEFVVLQPEARPEEALPLAERIRDTVARTPVIAGGEVLEVTISTGVTACTEPREGLEPLFRRAEEALKDAQDLGAGRVAVR